jgi:hypothetical protein
MSTILGGTEIAFAAESGWKRRPVLSATVAVIAVAFVMTVANQHASAQRNADRSITLRARTAAALDALEPVSRTSHSSQITKRPVTDLIVRLRSTGGRPLEGALSAPGSGRAGPDRATFSAELIVAAAGRLHVEDGAVCGPWDGNMALCRTECDGGAFVLVRQSGLDGPSFTLLIGQVPAIADAGFGESVRLGACSDTEAPGGLAPRGGTSFAEIVLDRR